MTLENLFFLRDVYQMNPRVHTLLALTLIENLGPTKLQALLVKKGSPKAVLDMYCRGVRKDVLSKATEIQESVKKLGGRVVSFHCREYPELLKQISDPPAVIYVKGTIPNEIKRSIAVVGTRMCSPEGKRFAELTVNHMADQNWPLVSGLAKGIDAAAHNAALSKGLPSVAVLAHGLERIHPCCNVSLANQIIKHGGAWITEHPPGTKVLKWMFAARNRILVGICQATVLAESPEKGGSMISLKLALSYNRGTYSFQPPNAYNSRWNGNRYIIAQNPKNAIKTIPSWHNQLLQESNDMRRNKKDQARATSVSKTAIEEGLKRVPTPCLPVYQQLSQDGRSILEISRATRTDITVVRTRLFILESLEMVKREPGDCYSRV